MFFNLKISLLVLSFLLLPLISWAQFEFDFDSFFSNDIESEFLLTLNGLDLVWSADVYTPYEYEGRKLPSLGTKITIEAIAKILGGHAGSLKYSWFLEGTFQETKSGYGRDTFSFYVSQNSNSYHTITLQIFNESRTVFEQKNVRIPVVKPEIVVYASNGNSHFSERVNKIANIATGKNFSFIAKPYFFSIKKLTDLNFTWYLGKKETGTSSAYDANVLSVNIAEKETEEILENDLWIKVTNKNDYREEATRAIKVRIY